ncbi:UDP-N-acetylmuramyl-tripeptide synthetase [Weissella koreensis]|uniref:Mur ligase family protein n=1 Tax=Weissella koreensis TaxID=165096 RepID=UPI0022BA4D56|nr:UDP-N-acetylmuramyl-tripeptide synthetase [Weissella koreensis]MCZ9310450.1 UDP-N-acetylmuramyl-tripeptide synthetase [Weissella koreensis]
MVLTSEQITNVLSDEGLLVQAPEDQERVFQTISYNSKQVESDSLFIIKGELPAKYLEEALRKGANGIVTQQKPVLNDITIPIWYVEDSLAAMSILSMTYYDYPQRSLNLIGVTGTKGKTSTTYMIYDILKHATDNKVALSSTISQITGPKPENHYRAHLTTPESLDLFKLMREAVDNGMTHMVMEVSSQAFKMRRVYGLRYNVGIFLNISPDHVGENEHPTFEDYLAHKMLLIDHSDQIILNAESQHFSELMARATELIPRDGIWLYGAQQEDGVKPDLEFRTNSANLSGSNFDLIEMNQQAQRLNIQGNYDLDLPGDFNESNATAAALASRLVGADPDAIEAGLEEVQIPGRMQMFSTQKHGTIYVDYAHNYASIAALLKFVRSNEAVKVLRVVVGAPGNKGVSRRPGIGKALSEGADVAILTADDPQFEDPSAIADEIEQNIINPKVEILREMDRSLAIERAISASGINDVVVIAAKGLDEYQKVNGVDTPYENDWNVAQRVVSELEN